MVLVEDKAILYFLLILALLVGGFALGIFSLDIFFSSITLGGILSTILLALLGLCCQGIDRPEAADTKARDDIWSESQVESRQI